MLAQIAGRVLGVLAEKQHTTPDQYPLSLNATLLACNQTSNREPVMSLTEPEVEATLAELKSLGLVRFVHPTHGRGVTKYRQVLDEKLALEPEQLALLTVLLLRGPQTTAELRTRSERLCSFDSVEHVERVLHALSTGDDPLVHRLERRPGQSQNRWQQLLAEEPPVSDQPTGEPGRRASGGAISEEIAVLRARVDELEQRLAALEALLT